MTRVGATRRACCPWGPPMRGSCRRGAGRELDADPDAADVRRPAHMAPALLRAAAFIPAAA
eukprot:297599-Chlamydomonas_euryale.AAC.1